ncbi:ribosome hibernation-promoting factor, HPF/YfiA family [Kocuria tytonis]|uniref:Ribosome hibernation promoting factor n=1 Tax=Kocuria tytonis TaxID=2054280 RepID=A0A495ABB4_9MICC|nr:ribosome-associated translation inhibitor RaiA [Kocuria tytonis]RKQ36714.1 ribosome-associated translation inhibitor RaiA [Kocuria tytonis]
MELNIQGRNVTLPDRFKEYVEEKSERFQQLGDKVQSIEVKVTKEHASSGHQGMRVELTVVGRGPVVRAEAHNDDKFAAFDEAYAKLVEQLRRARDRRKVHRGGHQTPIAVHEATGSLPVVPTASFEGFGSEQELSEAEDEAFSTEYPLSDAPTPVEIRRKRFPAHEITVDEAVDQMELVGHDFFLFVDKETREPSAVYRRKGWEYGVISLSTDGRSEDEKARAYQADAAS